MSKLIVTNGASGVACIRNASIEGDIFSWDDVLHDGPVPGGYDLKTLSELRARYISSLGWGAFEKVHQSFVDRDQIFTSAKDYDEFVLFFEHDLYDQLQLIQILFFFSESMAESSHVSLVYPPAFITYSTPEQLQSAFEARQKATGELFDAARLAWQAFTDESPENLEIEVAKKEPLLPHLYSSLKRLAEEFPDSETELSRTEHQILKALSGRVLNGEALFKIVQGMEEAAFMGDWSFFMYLTDLTRGDIPLVKISPKKDSGPQETKEYNPLIDGIYEITPAGESILRGEARKSQFIEIDRWIGGTYVTSLNFWRWNATESRFVAGS